MVRTHGFTLVELIVTLVIIGALALATAPIFFSVQVFQQSGNFNDAIASVRYAQKLAVATGCAVQVNFSANSLSLWQAAGAAACNTPPYNTAVKDPSDPNASFVRTAPSGISLSSTPTSFVFCPLGNAIATATACPSTATVDVTVTAGSQTFAVVGVTGHVR